MKLYDRIFINHYHFYRWSFKADRNASAYFIAMLQLAQVFIVVYPLFIWFFSAFSEWTEKASLLLAGISGLIFIAYNIKTYNQTKLDKLEAEYQTWTTADKKKSRIISITVMLITICLTCLSLTCSRQEYKKTHHVHNTQPEMKDIDKVTIVSYYAEDSLYNDTIYLATSPLAIDSFIELFDNREYDPALETPKRTKRVDGKIFISYGTGKTALINYNLPDGYEFIIEGDTVYSPFSLELHEFLGAHEYETMEKKKAAVAH